MPGLEATDLKASPPILSVEYEQDQPPPPESSDLPLAALIGGLVGGVLGCTLIGVCVYLYRKKQHAQE